MRRKTVFLLVALLLLQLMSFPVFAADSESTGIIGAIGGFFKTLGSLIKDWVVKGVEYILTGLKKLFIPRDDFFKRLSDRIYNAFQSKFGGILSLVNYLKERFSDLRAYSGELFVIQYPSDHLFGGKRVDLMQGADGIIAMIRTALSGFVVVCTAVFAYKKVAEMVNT